MAGIKGTLIEVSRGGGSTTPTIAVKKHGRAVLNRAAVSILRGNEDDEGWVRLWWSETDLILTVEATTADDPRALKLAKPTRQSTTGGFSCKNALSVIGWDFRENRGPIQGRQLVGKEGEAAIEFPIPAEFIIPPSN